MEFEDRLKTLEKQVTILSSKLLAAEKWQRVIEPWLLTTFQLDIQELMNLVAEESCLSENLQSEFTDVSSGDTLGIKLENERKRKGTEVERYSISEINQDNNNTVQELHAEDICIPTATLTNSLDLDFRCGKSPGTIPSTKRGRRNDANNDLSCQSAIVPSTTTLKNASPAHVLSFFCTPFAFPVGNETISVVEIPGINQFRRIGYKDTSDSSTILKQEDQLEPIKLEREEDLAKEEGSDSDIPDATAEQYYYNDETEEYVEEIVDTVYSSENPDDALIPLPPQDPPKINMKDWEMKCIICLKHFASAIRLVRHENRVHGTKKGHALKCMFQPNCRLIFRGVRQLSAHMKARHKNDYERLLKNNINPVLDFNIASLITAVSPSTLELLREAENASLGKSVPLPMDWNSTNYFDEGWLGFMEKHQDGIMPYSVICKREDLKLWLEYLPNEGDPVKSRYRCRLCFNYAHYLQLPVNSVYLLAKEEGQLRENECLNLRCINHHNRNSLTHKSIIRLLKELCDVGDDKNE